jgi:DnaJ-domain-containing protein 1
MGVNGSKSNGAGSFGSDGRGASDPLGVFHELGMGPWRPEGERPTPERRPVRNAERKALHALGLESDANATDIKAKFKVLVKRHHPDANGGDRSCEDRLREIIQAYNYLKSVGYC